MALDDYELDLQTEIVGWKCSRNADCNVKFIRRPRHFKLGMGRLVWSVQALALQNPSEYSFIIRDLKRSQAAAPDLPAKFELLLAGYKASMKTVRRVGEALDKLYAFSHLFALAEGNQRWEIVLDAEITGTACESAKAAVHDAAKAAAAILVEGFSSSPGGRHEIVTCAERSGWWIDEWTVADELWAASFFPRDTWKSMVRQFQAKAVQNGNVVQWCTVQVFDQPNPNFQFEIAVPEFLDGDDVLLRIGVANDRALTVRVFLTESVKVVCSQEGLEPKTSLGLGYLLPEVVRQYIKYALGENEGDLSNKNVVEGLLGHLTRYLAFLGNICVICGFDRLSDVPQSSSCSNICKARKQRYEDAIARFLPDLEISEKKRWGRREEYVKKMFKNSCQGRASLGNLLCTEVVNGEIIHKRTNAGSLCYEEAVCRVAKMKSGSISLALQIPQSDLWIDDAQTSQNFSFSSESP